MAKEDKNLVKRDYCIVLFSDNGWLQTSTSVTFLHKNFTREDDSKEVLVWDSYRCHYITDEIKTTLNEVNLVNVIIHGGCTPVIQTCDVVCNSPLKAHLRSLLDYWMRNGEKSYIKKGNMRSMTKMQLVDNIVKAWDMIPKDVIIKSFRICGQVKDVRPNDLLCMSQEKQCEEGIGKLQELLAFPTHQLDLNKLEVLPEGVVIEEMGLELDDGLLEDENALEGV